MDATPAVVATISKWEQSAYCGKGWYWILEELDQKLLKLDPNYRIIQVKEKFGELRYYFETEATDVLREIMYDCQEQAYVKAFATCMDCGNGTYRGHEYSDSTVETRYDGWVNTTCAACSEIRLLNRVKAEDNYANTTSGKDETDKDSSNSEV